MFTEYQKNVKFKNKILSSGIKALANKRKNKSQINLFPHINQSKIKVNKKFNKSFLIIEHLKNQLVYIQD